LWGLDQTDKMGNLTVALSFVIALNVLMFLTQAAILEVNPDATTFFTNKGTMLDSFDANKNTGNYTLDTDAVSEHLPTGKGSISVTTGNLFTDMFSSIKTWLADKTGLSYLSGIVSAPYNILKSMNLPNAFVFAMGTMWYVLTLFLLIAFIWGRDN